MSDKFYHLIIVIAVMITFMFILKNANHRCKLNTLPSYRIDTTYVDAFHVDSTGKYLINWKGDTCKRKTKLEE